MRIFGIFSNVSPLKKHARMLESPFGKYYTDIWFNVIILTGGVTKVVLVTYHSRILFVRNVSNKFKEN
uniref:Uncharacterized protein n=2 Tax=Ciona savignyi TaxID=51511 RepID=H2Z4Q9_CIOSA